MVWLCDEVMVMDVEGDGFILMIWVIIFFILLCLYVLYVMGFYDKVVKSWLINFVYDEGSFILKYIEFCIFVKNEYWVLVGGSKDEKFRVDVMKMKRLNGILGVFFGFINVFEESKEVWVGVWEVVEKRGRMMMKKGVK